MCQIRGDHLSTARIYVSQAVVDVGMPFLADAEHQRTARFGRSFSLEVGQTAEPRAPKA